MNSFENFASDMGPRPENHSLDRIDVNGNYTPENCRWATAKEQARNRRNSRFVFFRGRKITLTELAELFGVTIQRLLNRMRGGASAEEAVKLARTSRQTKHFVQMNGKNVSLFAASRLLEIPYGTLYLGCVTHGKSIDSVLSTRELRK